MIYDFFGVFVLMDFIYGTRGIRQRSAPSIFKKANFIEASANPLDNDNFLIEEYFSKRWFQRQLNSV